MSKMKLKYFVVVIALVLAGSAFGQKSDLPVPDAPGSWVNDYANVFSSAEKQALEQKLNSFQYRSSTQIFIVTISENNGYPVSVLAPEIGEKWGVGQKGKDNGIIILMDMEDRDVFIATGYGLEQYVTDLLAGRIVRNEIVPNFKQGNFYVGIDQATDVLIGLVDGEFTPDEYDAQAGGSSLGEVMATLFFIIFWFFIIFGARRRRSAGIGGRSNLPLWIALGMMSGGRSSGSFGNFSSGSGGFGGGFGGFTGGGGGSFGGGGAGGSW